ncbi:MAG: hypothetical protein HDT26_11175 [Subdoligranulum sp.]|nr:hypothetical protein [Subdoligranulum sp.]
MDYIDEIFTRADIQQIRAFLMDGAECVTDLRPYKERIDSAEQALSDHLHRDYPNENDFDEIISIKNAYGSAIENVYMEIGLQIGAILAAQVVWNVKKSYEKSAGL